MIVKVIVACAAFAAAAHAGGVATAYASRVDYNGPDLAVGIGRGDNDGWQGWNLGPGRDGDRGGKDGRQNGWGRGRGGDNDGWQGWDLSRGRDGNWDGRQGWDWGRDGRDGSNGKDGNDGRWGGWAGHGKPLATKTGSLWKYFGPHVPVVIGDNWDNDGKNDLGRGSWGGRA